MSVQVVVPDEYKFLLDVDYEQLALKLAKGIAEKEKEQATKEHSKKIKELNKFIKAQVGNFVNGGDVPDREALKGAFETLKSVRDEAKKIRDPLNAKIKPLNKAIRYLELLRIATVERITGSKILPRFQPSEAVQKAIAK